MTTAPEIHAALLRLQRSDTPHKRKSARLALNRTVRDWLTQTLAEYPALRADGTAVTPTKRRGSQPAAAYSAAACVDAVRKHFPDCPDAEVGNFLLSATCFPMGGPDDVAKNLRDALAAGCRTWHDAIGYADCVATDAMEKL